MIKVVTLHSLAKVYPDREINEKDIQQKATMLKNDVFSFQAAFRATECGQTGCACRIESDINDFISVRYVDYVPCDFTMYRDHLDVCEHPEAGLMPDILRDIPKTLWAYGTMWRSVWITVDCRNGKAAVGKHTITVNFDTNVNDSTTFELEILDAEIPAQSIPVTNWFHSDGLCRYYGVDFASEEFFRIAGNFIKCAVNNGINMILTPVFTPPLDTAPGGERLTAQLIDVTVNNGKFSFGFDKLARWIDICEQAGVDYLEISHFFTQWGCKYAPKVMATVDGEYKRIFGWETDGHGEEYLGFLRELLPRLKDFLVKKGVFARCRFHVSDEPNRDMMNDYGICSRFMREYIPTEQIIDALSDYEYYRQGLIDCPVAAVDHIQTFIDNNVENLWGYYCCGQVRTTNRFVACSSARNRVLGLQLFKFNIKGFLQWGFNFYNSFLSREGVNPYGTCTALGWVPGGDPFVVYPGDDGQPVESLRLAVFAEALRDLRALNALAKYMSREDIVRELGLESMTFTEFTTEPWDIINIREKVNKLLAERK